MRFLERWYQNLSPIWMQTKVSFTLSSASYCTILSHNAMLIDTTHVKQTSSLPVTWNSNIRAGLRGKHKSYKTNKQTVRPTNSRDQPNRPTDARRYESFTAMLSAINSLTSHLTKNEMHNKVINIQHHEHAVCKLIVYSIHRYVC